MKTTIKCIAIEGDFEFENYSEDELFHHIQHTFVSTHDAIFDKIAERIGIKKESEFYDPFGLFVTYENYSEIEDAANAEFTEKGYSRETRENGYTLTIPNYKMSVTFGRDFGGCECVKQIATIEIENL